MIAANEGKDWTRKKKTQYHTQITKHSPGLPQGHVPEMKQGFPLPKQPRYYFLFFFLSLASVILSRIGALKG